MKVFQTYRSLTEVWEKPIYARAYDSWWKREGYYFFDDKQQDKYMRENWPRLYKAYSSLPFPVMKADLWRYCIVYDQGGLYVDMDCALTGENIFDDTVDLHCSHAMWEHRLCQWIFSARKGSSILKRVIDRAEECIYNNVIDGDFYELTKELGPRKAVHVTTAADVFTEATFGFEVPISQPVSELKTKGFLFLSQEDLYSNTSHSFTGAKEGGWTQQIKKYESISNT